MEKQRANRRKKKKVYNHYADLRIRAGFKTKKDAAKALGVSEAAISFVESGKRKPKPDGLAQKMCAVYKCTMDELFPRKNLEKTERQKVV